MKKDITVAEAVELTNQIHTQPDCLFEVIREIVKENVEQYLYELKLLKFLISMEKLTINVLMDNTIIEMVLILATIHLRG